MKAHIREEKKTTPLKLGGRTLLQDNGGEIYKVCDTVEYNKTYTDEEVIKFTLSEENMIQERKILFKNGSSIKTAYYGN